MAGYSTEEIREHVAAYQRQPHGTKTAWLEQQPFSEYQIRRWRLMVYAGDVDKHLVPREAGGMKYPGRHLAEFERQRQTELIEHQAEVSKLQARIAELEGTNEALGKAIGLLHQMNEQEPAANPTTTDPSASSTQRTPSSES